MEYTLMYFLQLYNIVLLLLLKGMFVPSFFNFIL